MRKVCLNKNWSMHEAPLSWNKDYLANVIAMKEGWYTCDLPADVRMPLIEQGVIKDPVIADYCRESEWIEDRSWWFVKKFDSSQVCMDDDIIEVVLEGLDTRSDIFINGHFIGENCNVHTPFVYDIKQYIIDGENTLSVRVTSGLEEISIMDMAELDHAVCLESRNGGEFRGDERRAFVRRPQYTVGWDWGPKVITIGITGSVFLRSYKTIAIREVKVETLSIEKNAKLKVSVNVENLSFIGSKDCDISVELKKDGQVCAISSKKRELITSGYNYLDFNLEVENPCLWWPNGYGEQPLYTVNIVASSEGSVTEYPAFSYGIRTLSIDTSIISGDDRKFEVVVNNQPIYCKGGNWIPNDFIYARVPESKYHTLIDEAIEANFNMLRIWGGGLYERDLFYELCDQKGILIWNDFMFACSTYPDHQDWFVESMRKEMDYQTKRLRNHSSLALFCGTNEVHWIFNSTDNPRWNIEFSYEHQYGLDVANCLAKEVIHTNCAQIPYWNSSPYGGKLPNDDTVGDVHRWHNAFMSLKLEERIEVKDYDTINSKFVSEYGFVGPCCEETTKKYMNEENISRDSATWRMHCNVFERYTVDAAIEKNYIDDAKSLSLEDYILYGGMVHGLMYGYSLEAMRFKEHCYGGLIWMYNDAWGEVGWTIIDYYTIRKIPFYAVKRALAHQKFTMRVVNDEVVLQGVNDTKENISVKARLGYMSFDGKIDNTKEVNFEILAGERGYLWKEKLGSYDFTKGTMMMFVEDENIDSIWLRMDDMRNLSFESSEIEILSEVQDGDNKIVTVTSKGFAHGVYVKGDYNCSDNYFDILPNEKKTIVINGIKNEKVQISSVK